MLGEGTYAADSFNVTRYDQLGLSMIQRQPFGATFCLTTLTRRADGFITHLTTDQVLLLRPGNAKT